MGARNDAIKVNGKQYLQIEETIPIDLNGSVDGVIGQLQELRDQYGPDAHINICGDVDIDPWTDWCDAQVSQTLHYTRVETDNEREKRLEKNKKAREKRKRQQKEREQREFEQLQQLAKKHGKKVV